MTKRTMIGRVARALCAADGQDPDRSIPMQRSEAHLPPSKAWKFYLPAARAAISAMREPAPEMQAAGRDALLPYLPGGTVAARVRDQWEPSNKVFAAMIDAALKEEPK